MIARLAHVLFWILNILGIGLILVGAMATVFYGLVFPGSRVEVFWGFFYGLLITAVGVVVCLLGFAFRCTFAGMKSRSTKRV